VDGEFEISVLRAGIEGFKILIGLNGSGVARGLY
jgi:hypothetical protein